MQGPVKQPSGFIKPTTPKLFIKPTSMRRFSHIGRLKSSSKPLSVTKLSAKPNSQSGSGPELVVGCRKISWRKIPYFEKKTFFSKCFCWRKSLVVGSVGLDLAGLWSDWMSFGNVSTGSEEYWPWFHKQMWGLYYLKWSSTKTTFS